MRETIAAPEQVNPDPPSIARAGRLRRGESSLAVRKGAAPIVPGRHRAHRLAAASSPTPTRAWPFALSPTSPEAWVAAFAPGLCSASAAASPEYLFLPGKRPDKPRTMMTQTEA